MNNYPIDRITPRKNCVWPYNARVIENGTMEKKNNLHDLKYNLPSGERACKSAFTSEDKLVRAQQGELEYIRHKEREREGRKRTDEYEL